jgi:LPS-assembly protein
LGHAAEDFRKELDQLQRLRSAVEVQADSVDYSEGDRKVVAKGGVRVVMEGRSLFADEVTVDLDEQVMVATGNVVLMEGLNRLEGDRIEYNYRTNLGVITAGRGRMEPGVSFSGVEIRREGERTYRVKEGRFTTCRLCQPEPQTPDWEMRAGEAIVYLDEMIVSRDASFWVRGLPAFYTPIAGFPIGPRRTGFLIPRFGYANGEGFILRQPFFWAISPSQDLTVTGILRTERGLEFAGSYRYILAEDSRGEMSGRYLYNFNPSASGPQRNQWDFKLLHEQVLAPTWTFKADVQAVSDSTLPRSFAETPVLERTARTLPSNAFVTQATPQYMLLGLLNLVRDLQAGPESRIGYLPMFDFQWLPNPLPGTPLVLGGETSAAYLTRSQGEDPGRIDFYPALRLPLTLTPWLTATSLVAFRETAYTEAEPSGGGRSRTLVELGEGLSSRFARRFDEPGLGLSRLTHIVEPSVGYAYIPWTDQQSLPQFDVVDFISPQNRLSYQLTNRLIARWREASGETRSREVASLGIAQSWNLQPNTREFSDLYLTGLTPERVDQAVNVIRPLANGFSLAQERSLSNLVFNAGLNPIAGASFRGTLAFNTEDRRTDAINAGLEFHRPDLLTLDAAYTYDRGRQANGFVSRVRINATKTILLDFLTRYAVNFSTLLENTINLRYTSCCWELGLRYTYRASGPGEKAQNLFLVTFDLKTAPPAGQRPEPWRLEEEATGIQRLP